MLFFDWNKLKKSNEIRNIARERTEKLCYLVENTKGVSLDRNRKSMELNESTCSNSIIQLHASTNAMIEEQIQSLQMYRSIPMVEMKKSQVFIYRLFILNSSKEKWMTWRTFSFSSSSWIRIYIIDEFDWRQFESLKNGRFCFRWRWKLI